MLHLECCPSGAPGGAAPRCPQRERVGSSQQPGFFNCGGGCRSPESPLIGCPCGSEPAPSHHPADARPPACTAHAFRPSQWLHAPHSCGWRKAGAAAGWPGQSNNPRAGAELVKALLQTQTPAFLSEKHKCWFPPPLRIHSPASLLGTMSSLKLLFPVENPSPPSTHILAREL